MPKNDDHFLRHLKALRSSVFFKGSTEKSLTLLLKMLKVEEWKPKTFKNSQDLNSTFYFIVSGKIKVYKSSYNTGRKHTVFVLSGGDVFDILSYLHTKSVDFNWEAIDNVTILKISMPKLRKWILENPNMHKAILYYLGNRMQQLMSVATDITLHSTLVRLANLLLNNINEETQKLELINKLPNVEIAALIGTTRAVVNRHIQQLKQCGAIIVARKNIEVINKELLLTIIQQNSIPESSRKIHKRKENS